jgi:hypothetical protein
MKPLSHFKNKSVALLSAFLVIASFNATAQSKSVYDVIPGSGPKKSSPAKDVVFFPRKSSRANTYPVYNHKKKNLPPGQAKKIYGGSATDYAPGQVKKHGHHKNWHREHGKKEHGKHD